MRCGPVVEGWYSSHTLKFLIQGLIHAFGDGACAAISDDQALACLIGAALCRALSRAYMTSGLYVLRIEIAGIQLMRRVTTGLIGLALVICLASRSSAEGLHDCDNPESTRRVAACTELIEDPSTAPTRRALAYANRALSYSIRGEYETAIRDYDQAIGLFPDFAVALNNRAWAYFKWGRGEQGMGDVQRALQLDPRSPHALDTRAHIYQTMGETARALRDYEAAMMFGGSRMITLYQCGLKMQRLYDGPADGVARPALLQALKVCVDKGPQCDPLPPDEECRDATS